MVASLLIWFAASCSRGPAQIAVSAPGVPTDAKPPAVSPDDAGDEALWLTEALRDDFPPVELEVGDSSAPDARSDAIAPGGQLAAGDASPSADASTPVAVINAKIPGKDFPVYCFAWVHLSDFSTDCFRRARECEQARRRKAMGHRLTSPCEKRLHAACTTVVPDGDERCFETATNCVRYRNFLAARGMETTVCVYR
jgi:hypothetical protein